MFHLLRDDVSTSQASEVKPWLLTSVHSHSVWNPRHLYFLPFRERGKKKLICKAT